MKHHMFSVSLAKEYGIEIAAVIYNLSFWIEHNKANNKNFYDGKYWTYNSAEAFEKLLPYFSANQIRRVLKKMEELKIIQTSNYNKVKYDRTLWYAFTDAFYEKHKCILQNSEMEVYETQNGFSETERPIPDNKPDDKPDDNNKIKSTQVNNSCSPTEQEVRKKYGEYKKVLLTDKQFNNLKDKWGIEELEKWITILDEGIQMKGYKYKDFNLALQDWRRREIEKNKDYKPATSSKPKTVEKCTTCFAVLTAGECVRCGLHNSTNKKDIEEARKYFEIDIKAEKQQG